jgi:hypothetical protein
MSDRRDGGTARSDAVEDLRATSDSIRADVSRLASIEGEKVRLDPGDPLTDRLSAEAVDLADRIQRQTKAEREIAREIR